MPNPPPIEELREDFEGREPPMAPELVALLLRLHELRLATGSSLKAIADAAQAADPEGRKWAPNRVDEQLRPKGRGRIPALAVRAALVELSFPDTPAGWRARRRQTRERRQLTEELDALTVAAAGALGEETAGNLFTSKDRGGNWLTRTVRRRGFLALSGLVLVIGAATVPVAPGVYAAHERFEQCITDKGLKPDPVRGPMRTLVQWPLSAPTPETTTYSVLDQAGALQATVVFTSNAQAARGVLDSNKRFYEEHGVFDNDFTVGDTTVVTPQVANAKSVARDCANGA